MSLRNEERIQQLYQPIGDLSAYYDQRVRQLLVPRTRVDELRDNASERAEQAEAAREAERKAREAKRASEKASKAAQAKIIAETARECAAAARKRTRRGRVVPIFTAEQIGAAEKSVAVMPEERCERLKPILAEIRRDDGYRKVPSLRSIDRKLGFLRQKFANLAMAIDRLGAELALAGASRPADFRVTPLLLVGEPGLGKTYFARSLAKALGVDMEVISEIGRASCRERVS
jgi:ATP-dependent Lon protease